MLFVKYKIALAYSEIGLYLDIRIFLKNRRYLVVATEPSYYGRHGEVYLYLSILIYVAYIYIAKSYK